MTEWEWPGLPIGKHYKVNMSVRYHKLVLILIWPQMLLGHKIDNKQEINKPRQVLTSFDIMFGRAALDSIPLTQGTLCD